jgi:hypothetical protein
MFQKYPEITIDLQEIKNRPKHKDPESGDNINIYTNNDDINGEVQIIPKQTPFEHTGIHLELIGIISNLIIILVVQNLEDYKSEFLNIHKELEPPGELNTKLSFNFSFKKVSLPFDTYESPNIVIK